MPDQEPVLLSNLPADRRQEGLAVCLASLLLIGFLFPLRFAHVQLPPSGGVIVLVAAITFIVDLITATLLFIQFSVSGLAAVAALASGYLLSGVLMIPYVLTFPGAFSPSGLLGAGLETSPYLFMFWHAVPSSAVIAYVLLKERRQAAPRSSQSLRHIILFSVISISTTVCAFTWFVTANEALLPAVLRDGIHVSPLWHYPPILMVLLNLAAFAFLWRRRESVLDLWLLVQSWGWLLESLLLNFIGARFDVAFYAARIFWVSSSSLVLLVLLSQFAILNMRVVLSSLAQRRSRGERLASLEMFSASIAHELRQPLAAIVWHGDAAVNWLEQSPPNTAEVRGCLGGIASAAHRAADALDSVRGMFRKDATFDQSLFDINELVREAVHVLRQEIDGLRVTVQLDLASQLPMVSGHRSQLGQVILNLIKNATDAMSPVSNRPRILALRTEAHAVDGVVVSVADTGVGIDATLLDRIFDVFYSGKSDGMGLGLAISRSFIDAHGGRLWAESTRDRGSTFRFTLPHNPGV